MNEQFSLARLHRIDLALEPPFALGRLRVRPAALEVADGAKVETLEPRVMQVLVALFRGRGEPVSRDSLIDLCWQGRFVGEDALNRCIARLRRVLAADPAVHIDTIAKVGYRLRADAVGVVTDDVPSPPPAASPERQRLRLPILAGAALAAAVAATVGLLLLRPPAAWSAEGFRPLTTEPGVETHPALSPDGRMVVYAAGPGANAPRNLYLRGVEDGRAMHLTSHPDDDVSPVWSPDASRIAFVRANYREPCRIVVMPIPAGAERVVGRCAIETTTRTAWLDARTLLVSDRTSFQQPRRIRAIDVETGYVRDITTPPPGILGDADPLPSPDGSRLVFRRTLAHGVDDLHVVDLRSGRDRELTADGWKAHGAAWAADGRHLFFASNRGGDFGLWVIDTRGGQPRRVSLGVRTFGRMSADRGNQLVVEASDTRVNLARVSATGASTFLTSSNGYDWDPDIARDGAVAYVSDQSGASELWLLPPSGHPQRLTRLNASYVHSTAFSPDGSRILMVVAKDRKVDLWTVARDGSQLRRHTFDGAAKIDPVFTPDGRSVIYPALGPAGWRLMRQVLDSGEARPVPVPGGGGFTALQRGGDGRLYGQRAGDQRLWSLPANGGPPTLVPDAVAEDDGSWAAGPNGLYLVRERQGGADSLWFRPWGGRTWTRLAAVPQAAWRPELAVHPVTGEIVMAQWVQDDADLALLSVRR